MRKGGALATDPTCLCVMRSRVARSRACMRVHVVWCTIRDGVGCTGIMRWDYGYKVHTRVTKEGSGEREGTRKREEKGRGGKGRDRLGLGRL